MEYINIIHNVHYTEYFLVLYSYRDLFEYCGYFIAVVRAGRCLKLSHLRTYFKELFSHNLRVHKSYLLLSKIVGAFQLSL